MPIASRSAPDPTARGTCKYKLRQYEEALADYNQALAVDPDYAYALANRAVVYTTLGEDQPGQADMFRAIELGMDTMQVAYAVRNADHLT